MTHQSRFLLVSLLNITSHLRHLAPVRADHPPWMAIGAPQQDSYHPGQGQRLPNCMCSDGHGCIVLGKNRGK